MKSLTRTALGLGLFQLCLAGPACAQGTAFTYQGRLENAGAPAHGSYDLRFAVFAAAAAGSVVASAWTTNGVLVSNGLFTVTLDFGAGTFTGPARWLEIGVRTNGGSEFTTLDPRQPLTPSPYAVHAGVARTVSSNAVGSLGIADGSISTSDLSSNLLEGTFWRLGGNTGAGHFLGSMDNQPVEFRVNGARALRLEYSTAIYGTSPNLIGGHAGNGVTDAALGGVIGGGGADGYENRVGGAFTTVVGGLGNTAIGWASTAMGSGTLASNLYSTAMGDGTRALGNTATAMGSGTSALGDGSTAMGGSTTASGWVSTAMGQHTHASGWCSTAMGQHSRAAGYGATALGVLTQAHGEFSTAAGSGCIARGASSTAMGSESLASNALSTALGWGTMALGSASTAMGDHTIASGDVSTAIGRSTAARGADSIAMGISSEANHSNTFVWSDGASGAFVSTTNNQFLIHASGGVGIGTNAPGAMLQVGSATCDGTTWANASDRNAKEHFERVNAAEVLDHVVTLPLHRWNYKAAPGVKHVGPVAQDFHAAFGLNGADDKHIATVDADGVALAAIQALNQKLEETRAGNHSLRSENAELKARLERLERLVEQGQRAH